MRQPHPSRRSARRFPILPLLLLAGLVSIPAAAWADEPSPPNRLADRGAGIPTSLFGTYIEKGDLLLYTFYEYTRTSAFEYKPSELGYSGGQDYLGKTVEHEGLVFLGYGISDRLAFELEAALYTRATLDKAADDPSAAPSRLEESGLGDVDMQLRFRWREETERSPYMFSFLEVTPPLQRDKKLIGTQDLEAALGFGVIRGYRWGTITGRAAVAWDGADSKLDLGEYAFEYLKRLSPGWRVVATVEGETDEVSVIGEAQWFFRPNAFLKLNCGFGVTQKAPDVAPEVGVLFRF